MEAGRVVPEEGSDRAQACRVWAYPEPGNEAPAHRCSSRDVTGEWLTRGGVTRKAESQLDPECMQTGEGTQARGEFCSRQGLGQSALSAGRQTDTTRRARTERHGAVQDDEASRPLFCSRDALYALSARGGCCPG
jgi:hypothetical protein